MTTRRQFVQLGLASLAAASASAQEPETKYRGCIIGMTGRGGYGHDMHRVFAHRPDVTPMGLSDPDPDGRLAAAAVARARRTYANYQDMIEKERPNLISIGPRWPEAHRDMVVTAAAARASIYMEKPLALSPEEGDEMVRAVGTAGVRCAVAHQMRLAPEIQALRARIGDGLIGELLEMRGRGKEDKRAGGEDLIVLGCHVFDLMRFFAGGDPIWCSARITAAGRDITLKDARDATEPIGPVAGDTVHAAYAFKDGLMGYFASQKNADPDGGGRFGLDLYGTHGVASIRLGLGNELGVQVLLNPKWRADLQSDPPKSWRPLDEFENPDPDRRGGLYLNSLAMDDLIASVEEKREPALSLKNALAAYEMSVAPFAAALGGGRVEFPLQIRTHPLIAV